MAELRWLLHHIWGVFIHWRILTLHVLAHKVCTMFVKFCTGLSAENPAYFAKNKAFFKYYCLRSIIGFTLLESIELYHLKFAYFWYRYFQCTNDKQPTQHSQDTFLYQDAILLVMGLIQINLKCDCKSSTVLLCCIIDTYDIKFWSQSTTLVSRYQVVSIVLHNTIGVTCVQM